MKYPAWSPPVPVGSPARSVEERLQLRGEHYHVVAANATMSPSACVAAAILPGSSPRAGHPSIPAPSAAALQRLRNPGGTPSRARLVLRALRPHHAGRPKEDDMSTRSRTRLTPEQRDASRRQQLSQATDTLLTSDGWQRWLRTRSRFHRYSLRNTLLIAFQCPHATHVAGFRKWLELGRCVRKGEKAIRIFAPVRYRDGDGDGDESEKTAAEEKVVGFKLAAIFDVAQTEPLPGVDPAPLDPPGQPITGDSHAAQLVPLERHAASLGYTVDYEQLDGPNGYCSARENRIVIDTALPPNGKVTTLVHELAHAHGIDYQRFSRAEAELIVESVACIVCAGAGLDTGGESIPYIAAWNPEQAVERIQLLTATIDEIARRIENALDSGDELTAAVVVPA